MKRLLILEDGSVYEGNGFGGNDFKVGELIFHTGMCGYQEIISDGAYYGHIVMMTYPAVGNVGINRDDFESMRPELFGLVVKEYNDFYSNFRGEMSLDEYMKLKGIPGISNIDTRAITRKIREAGVMKAILADKGCDIDEAVKMLKSSQNVTDGVREVSTTKAYTVPSRSGLKVALLDLGVKYGIIRELNKLDCEVVVLPYDTSWQEILSLRADGLIISSGPGSADSIDEVVSNIKALKEKMSILGIGLGHQAVAKAMGCKIDEMKFGIHSNSCPVIRLEENKIYFTSQNCRYQVDRESLADTQMIETYRALNDGSLQGLKHEQLPIVSYQFVAEAAPGADDVSYIFKDFIDMIRGGR